MHHAAIFVGYREFRAVPVRRPRLPLAPVGLYVTPRLTRAEVLNLGKLPYELVVYSGTAEDAYPADYVQLPYISLITFLLIWDGPACVRFEHKVDGVQFPERETDRGFMSPEAVTGFMIRNAHAGHPSRYQFVFFR